MAVAFDTLRFAQTLRSGGYSPEQAEATARAFAEATTDQLVTKADLQQATAELRGEIADVRVEIGQLGTELRAEIADVRVEIAALRAEMPASRTSMVMWFTGVMIAQAGAIVAMIKLL